MLPFPARYFNIYCLFQRAVLSKISLPSSKENTFPANVEASALRQQHDKCHNSFTSSPAVLLPQPYPATPANRPSQHRALSPLPAAAPAASPLKASLVVQPAARVASPVKVPRVSAAAAVAAEQGSRLRLAPTQATSSGVIGPMVDNQQQPEVNFQGQGSPRSSRVRAPSSPRAAAAAAAESASRLLQHLDCSTCSASVDGMESSSSRGTEPLPVGITSREQLLLWMQVSCVKSEARVRCDTYLLQGVDAKVHDLSASSDD
jgi:hypothetical protein